MTEVTGCESGRVRQTPLLERDREITAIAEAISDVRESRGRLIVLAGKSGVGKTRLLAHLRRLPQAADLAVVSAKNSDLETELRLRRRAEPPRAEARPTQLWNDLGTPIERDDGWSDVPPRLRGYPIESRRLRD